MAPPPRVLGRIGSAWPELVEITAIRKEIRLDLDHALPLV
jgi:hypothetical protein